MVRTLDYHADDLGSNPTPDKLTKCIEADLFYVRDGAINDYAISFVVPMKTGTDDLQFSWQSRTSYPATVVPKLDTESRRTAARQRDR
ncbi:hypothetical protein RP20_CCG014042 [Aedes albopictus]|nr:hypothetical protein RP20_CCG014042 [Aedes albopictus]